jgi:hypothetical protein
MCGACRHLRMKQSRMIGALDVISTLSEEEVSISARILA